MRRILIVDDEPVVADTLRLIFAQNGFTARAAYSTDEAMACASEFDPDILLCDINMPHRDGMELITEMDQQKPACQILVLTGAYSSMERVRERAVSLKRRFSILAKPCQPDDVLRAAGELLLAS